MLHFLTTVRESMTASRRTLPTPQDFNFALALSDLAPSQFTPHLNLELPESISYPPVSLSNTAESTPPDLAPMLGTELAETSASTHPYIPAHFPGLPSRHAWLSTPVFTEREQDPRKIRERATQEGILAEQALRKLTTASKARSRERRATSQIDQKKEQLWQDTLADLLGDDDQSQRKDVDGDIMLDGTNDRKPPGESKMSADLLWTGDGMVVNHDQGHWRRGTSQGGIRIS